MKLHKGLILLFLTTMLTACIPDTWTKWQVQDPSAGEGATPGLPPGPGPTPPDPNVSTPPTDIAYTPPSAPTGRPEGTYFYDQTSQVNTGEMPDPLVCIALNGGEIREGDMSFFVSQVTTKDNVITGEKSLPQGMVLNPLTGEITGFTQVFTDGKKYTIQGDHIGGSSVNTTIQITISTKPESLYYPQANGLSLVLNVDKPENFRVGNAITSNRNAQGVVTYVDIEKKILHIQVAGCTQSVADCPVFVKDDLIDDTIGFFREEAKITEEVTYAYQNTVPIQNMIPVVLPAVDGELPEFSISPDIRDWGIDFDRNTGTISGVPETGTCSIFALKTVTECGTGGGTWTSTGIVNLPKTLFTVTVKNINGETANVAFNLSSLDVISPQAINSISYNYLEDYRVVLNLEDLRSFSKGSSVTNQLKTSGIVIGIDDTETGEDETTIAEAEPGSILLQIKNSSELKFENEQAVDDSDPFVIPLTRVTGEPQLVFLLMEETSIPVTIEPTLSQSEQDSLYWKSEPVLPHLCTSILNPETVYYPEEDSANCTGNNGVCADGSGTTESTCTLGQWTTDGIFNNTQELFFNRRTGKFGAKDPNKAFLPQKFDVTVTTLDGTETKTSVTFGFQSSPENLSYSDQVILEVDKFDRFELNDFVSTPANAVGIVKGKETSDAGEKLLIVKVLAGEFLKNADIDNQKVFTYQKANIKELSYGQVGLALDQPATIFEIGEEISVGTCIPAGSNSQFDCEGLGGVWTAQVAGFVQYRQTAPLNIIWVRLIKLNEGSEINQTFVTGDRISGTEDNNTSIINSVFGDVLNVRHLGSVDFAAGMDVAANPTEGFGMVNAAENAGGAPGVILSHASGVFSIGSNIFRMNPFDTQNPPSGGQGSSSIQGVGQIQTFYIDRENELPIQPVLDSPEDNGVTFSITPPLPIGLTLDEKTGKISKTEETKGPIASNLNYYTVVARNLLGEASTLFGLKVREVFAIEDITGLDGSVNNDGQVIPPNLSSVLHKSGQGYNNFRCRVTSDQVNAMDADAPPNGWATRAKDIVCLYDVGEADLFYNGLKVKINVGSDLCQYVEHVPTWFYAYQVQTTDPTTLTPVTTHTGQWVQPQCAPAQPNNVRTEFPDGDPVEQCTGNYALAGGPNCDEGTVPTLQREYSVVGACAITDPLAGDYNPDVTGATNSEECFNNNGVCSDGGTDKDICFNTLGALAWNSGYVWVNNTCLEWLTTEADKTSCEDNHGTCAGGVGGELNREQCSNNGGAWTPTSTWTDNATCSSVPGIIGEEAECGGEKVNCIAGPAKDDPKFPQDNLTDRFGKDAFGQVLPVTSTEEIVFTYASPKSKDYKSNLYLSNYSRLNQCTPYGIGTPGAWTGDDYEYNINVWTDVGRNNDPDTADADNNPFAGGNGVYDYRCLDGARNVRARIRLLIREWDWNFQPSNQVDVMNLVNPPWTPDGTLMDDPPGSDIQGFPANSFLDWDDQNRAPIPPYPTGGGTCDDPEYRYPENDL